MEIKDRISILEKFIDLVEGKIEFAELPVTPSTKIVIKNIEGFGLYSNEIYSIIDIKKAIDDQLYLAAKYITGKSIPQNNEIYFALNDGSIEIDALFEFLVEAVKNPQFGIRGMIFLFAISVVWTSPDFFSSWVSLQNNSNTEKNKIELKRMEFENEENKRQHDMEMKALELIEKDEELRKVASRSFETYAKILKNVRNGSEVEINGLSLNKEQVSDYLRLTSAYDEWATHIEGRFAFLRDKKKEKERYVFTIQNVENKKKYDVTINFELYDKRLRGILQEASRKSETLYAKIKFIKKDDAIEKIEFSEIKGKAISSYQNKNLSGKSRGRKKPSH